jgi:hypothetical protein
MDKWYNELIDRSRLEELFRDKIKNETNESIISEKLKCALNFDSNNIVELTDFTSKLGIVSYEKLTENIGRIDLEADFNKLFKVSFSEWIVTSTSEFNSFDKSIEVNFKTEFVIIVMDNAVIDTCLKLIEIC